MRRVLFAFAGFAGAWGLTGAAEARVAIQVDVTSQTMHVSSASGDYEWPISSARFGYNTPRGTFGVQRLVKMHYSRKYNNAPMPHALFFTGGYAIHGTYETASLGTPASHGCIRIAPRNAAALYQMVQAEGGAITIAGSSPASATRYARRARAAVYAGYGDDDGEVGVRGYAGSGRYAGSARRHYGYGGDGFFYQPSQPIGYGRQGDPRFYQWMGEQSDD